MKARIAACACSPYVEGALGRWFPVTKDAQEKPFWQADPHRRSVYNQYKDGTVTFEFTKNYKFTILNNENVWAKAANRVINEKVPVDKAVDEAESERIRGAIARDVHDVVGHSLAVIIAQADSVPFLHDEARIREVSATIASTARSSLLEVRQVLGHIDGTGDRVDPGSLEEIVQGIRDAGVDVDRTVRGTPRAMRSDTGTAIRRVLQEMLTNALRHGAPGRRVTVRETWRSADLVLEVENAVPSAEPAVGEGLGIDPRPSTAGSGRGLTGMQSRLTTIGGSFDAAVLDAVFTARARIPFDVHGGTNR